jgi:hypothetical protein
MDAFNGIIGALLRWCFAALSWAPPAAGLIVISILAGVGMLWVFKKTSNAARIRAVKRLVQAHLLEMRLFRDEPGVVWRAQKSLMAENLRYIGLMLRPALWMAAPLALLLIHLEGFYGRAPLAIGQAAIVTMAMRPPVDERTPAPLLAAPPGIAIESPAVRILDEGQVSWRIRPVAEASGELRFTVGGETVNKRIEAGAARFVPGRRVSSLVESLWDGDEPRIRSPTVDWIDIRYPEAAVELFGIRMHWLIWFTIISMLLALVLRKRFGVVL